MAQRREYPGELHALPMSRQAAVNYYISVVYAALSVRVSPSRARMLMEKLLAYLGTDEGQKSIPLWKRKIQGQLVRVTLSVDQQAFSDHLTKLLEIAASERVGRQRTDGAPTR